MFINIVVGYLSDNNKHTDLVWAFGGFIYCESGPSIGPFGSVHLLVTL